MRRFLSVILGFLSLFISTSAVVAATDLEYRGFYSDITINQDLSITVTETITVEYLVPKHGIFRNVPGKRLKVLSVTDEKGNDYKYQVTGGNVKEIKIGDADVTITGEHIYVVTYKVRDAIKEFPDHFELYWNVTGSDWDSDIPEPTTSIESSFATITKIKCFAGVLGTNIEACDGKFEANVARFSSEVSTGVGSDFTIVVGLDKNNQFTPPTQAQRIIDFILEHWFYLLTPLPFIIPFYFWLKKGRDQRYLSENIYYKPSDAATRTVGLFERKHIPLVYSPIKGLSPAQIGTIIDEKVDMQDVVAEITELARLGFLKLKKIPKKGLFGKDDYEFTKIEKDANKLRDYQKIVLDGLFEGQDTVKLSALKLKFYTHLKKFKEALYENMQENKYFEGNPDKVRSGWLVGLFVISIFIFVVINFMGIIEEDFLPLLLLVFFAILGFFFAKNMPRRTPEGYSLYRQIEGLKWYIDKGLWKHEIAEKRLFIEEMLPLAITLGVVTKLAKDMTELGIKPPSYVGGVSAHSFASDMGSMQSNMGTALASAPGGSGGSGFSGGGSSGGGGGGGGGGGW